MTRKRIMIAMGSGCDRSGGDPTAAVCEAVRDALQSSVVTLPSSLGYDDGALTRDITVAVERPDEVDRQAVARLLPEGRVVVRAVSGGLSVDNPGGPASYLVASAAIETYLEHDGAADTATDPV